MTVVAFVPIAEGSVQLIYRTPDGDMKERFLNSADEPSVDIASAERPFSFDGDDAAFQLACEAKRIDLAFLLATRTRLPSAQTGLCNTHA